jgi:hypothetical protein
MHGQRRLATSPGTYHSTLILLDRELVSLDAGSVVLQLAIDQPVTLNERSSATLKTRHPGVLLSFVSKHGFLLFGTDAFTRWSDNLRAVAVALESLRRLDRYGVAGGGEQYVGWRVVDAEVLASDMTAEDAAVLVAEEAGQPLKWQDVLADRRKFRTCYRSAVRRVAATSSVDRVEQVQEAGRILEREHAR